MREKFDGFLKRMKMYFCKFWFGSANLVILIIEGIILITNIFLII